MGTNDDDDDDEAASGGEDDESQRSRACRRSRTGGDDAQIHVEHEALGVMVMVAVDRKV